MRLAQTAADAHPYNLYNLGTQYVLNEQIRRKSVLCRRI